MDLVESNLENVDVTGKCVFDIETVGNLLLFGKFFWFDVDWYFNGYCCSVIDKEGIFDLLMPVVVGFC